MSQPTILDDVYFDEREDLVWKVRVLTDTIFRKASSDPHKRDSAAVAAVLIAIGEGQNLAVPFPATPEPFHQELASIITGFLTGFFTKAGSDLGTATEAARASLERLYPLEAVAAWFQTSAPAKAAPGPPAKTTPLKSKVKKG